MLLTSNATTAWRAASSAGKRTMCGSSLRMGKTNRKGVLAVIVLHAQQDVQAAAPRGGPLQTHQLCTARRPMHQSWSLHTKLT